MLKTKEHFDHELYHSCPYLCLPPCH